jgi:hypothetical protein
MFSVFLLRDEERILAPRLRTALVHWRIARWQEYVSNYQSFDIHVDKQRFLFTLTREYILLERKLAVGMAFHSRLGAESPLRDMEEVRDIIAGHMRV